jgi:hypothetical protein
MTDEVLFGSVLNYEEAELDNAIAKYKSDAPREIDDFDQRIIKDEVKFKLNGVSKLYIDNFKRLEATATEISKAMPYFLMDKLVDLSEFNPINQLDSSAYRKLILFKAVELAEPALDDKMSRLFYDKNELSKLKEVSKLIHRILPENFMENFPNEETDSTDNINLEHINFKERLYYAPASTESRFDSRDYWNRVNETEEFTPGSVQSLRSINLNLLNPEHIDFYYYFEDKGDSEYALLHVKKLEWLLESDVPSVFMSIEKDEAIKLVKPRLMAAVEQACVSKRFRNNIIYSLNENILVDLEETLLDPGCGKFVEISEKLGKQLGYQQKEIDEYCIRFGPIMNSSQNLNEKEIENFFTYLHSFDSEELKHWVNINCVDISDQIGKGSRLTARSHLAAQYPVIHEYLSREGRLDDVFPKKVNLFRENTHKELADYFNENCLDENERAIPYNQIRKDHQQFFNTLRSRSREFREHLLYRSYFEYPEE